MTIDERAVEEAKRILPNPWRAHTVKMLAEVIARLADQGVSMDYAAAAVGTVVAAMREEYGE